VRALVQRVSKAEVAVDGQVIGQSGPGLLILVCAMQGDTEAEAVKLAAKIAKLRIFQDDAGKMNRSLIDTGGGALVVSQFTLAADTARGNRPGFSTAAARRTRGNGSTCISPACWPIWDPKSRLERLGRTWP
jgi:D-tyrosyl-tRNA(Tyr) deacylase